MVKKLAIYILTLLVSCVLFSGCTDDSDKQEAISGSDKPLYEWGKITGETLTVWGDRSDLVRPYIVRAFKNYEAATGNTIKTVALSKKDLNIKVPNAFNQSDAEKPDLLLSYGGTNLENLKPDENFYDFTDAIWVNDLTDTALNQAIYNGKVIGLPHGEASISGTLYNKEIFKKYNIEIPKTQDEFLSACETLLKNGITPMYLPYAEITMLLYQFPMDSIVQDKNVLADLNSGKLSYSQIPEMRKIIDWYKTMSDRGYFGKDYTGNDWNGMDGAMKNGEYAMMLCWDTWIYTDYTGDTNNIGLMPAFVGIPDNGCFEGANVILILANKNSPKIDASLDLINFMVDPYNYNVSYEGLYTVSLFKNQVGNIATPQYVENEVLIEKLYYDSTAWSRIRGFSQIDAIYIQRYMKTQSSPEECLNNMDAARIKRAGINE